jgi:putative exosortase-associated protein (TIGR04073 family)
MKKLLALLLVLTVCASGTFAQEGEEDTPMLNRMAQNSARGFANILTGWVELPRNMWLETARNPYYGLLTGISDGSWLSFLRTFGGTIDFVTVGLTGQGFHGEQFPEYVWDSTWMPGDAMIDQ